MDEKKLNQFKDAVNDFAKAFAELRSAMKKLSETIHKKNLPDWTIQENLASEAVLRSATTN